uniref:GDP/GTP exchange factor Sec2 N-terminal domain-containing protein n=1 Tax=Mycena chlorophos TaxID=658473 RepID=A0ABQ0LK38_MYCCL|nr:predicted protein [Mycena chlorophos]
MASSRHSGASDAAPLLVTFMKENAELKSQLHSKNVDIQAAEAALMLLVKENQELAKEATEATEAAREVETESSRRIRDLTERLEVADDEIERLRAEIKRRDQDIVRLAEDNDLLEEANAHLNRRRDDQGFERDHSRSARTPPESNRRWTESRPSAPASAPVPQPWLSGANITPSTSAPPPYSPSNPWMPKSTTAHLASPPVIIRRSWQQKPVSERTILNQHMSKFPFPTTIRKTFSASTALAPFNVAHRVLDACTGPRPPLYVPGRILWVSINGHALAYAPTHEYHQGSWRPHTHLTALAAANAEVELFVSHSEKVHYAGTYRVHSLRDVKGYMPGGDIPAVEISHPAIYRTMNLRQHVPDHERKIRENTAWPDGRPKVECFGLQHVGFDEELQRSLRSRFERLDSGSSGTSDVRVKLEDRIGGKRRWDDDGRNSPNPSWPGGEASDGRPDWKKKKKLEDRYEGGSVYSHKTWVRTRDD